ncbi:MAG TPA: site-specific integrase, partial [Candidatus Dormibacteraeota bacterium]|nr:site-specific integrase [Candidatus Dormibacteraeota bacterium]
GLAVKNVADLVDPPRRATSEIRPLSLTETQTFLAHADSDRFAALYVLAITTGMRQGELLGLHWRDIDLSARVLRVRGSLQRTKKGLGISEPKTSHSRRQVELAAIAVEALRDHQDRQQAERSRWPGAWADLDLVFPNEIGRPVEAGNLIRRSFWPILDRAGLRRIRFHDLRHTAATLLLAKSVHPKVVSEMLGHSRIGITLDLYSHVTRTMQREATDAMDDLLKS